MKLLFSLFILLSFFSNAQSYKDKADQLLTSDFSNGPGCAALVSQNGNVNYSFATGFANIETNTPMNTEHIFRIGSITKQFTAIGILILEERGKLDLNDSIQQYLPTFPSKSHTITIEHLLTHTSGLKSYTEPDIMNAEFMRQYHHPDSLVHSFSEYPLAFEPGSQFSYCNSGYHLLGLIIEKVSRMSYKKFLQKEIFSKAGMENTRTDNQYDIIPNRASGYSKNKEIVNAQYIDMSIPYSAGNIISTVHDLNKWYTTLFDYSIVSKETLKRAHTPYTLSTGEISNYGYGWGFDTIADRPIIKHSGGIPGFLSNAIYFPEEHTLIVVLSNCLCNPPMEVSEKIAELAIEDHK